MKTTRNILILLSLAVLLSTACDELLSDLLKFNSQWYPREFSIDATDELGDVLFISDNIDANIDSALAANGISQENLRSVRMSDAKVTVLTEGHTFDPVTKIELFMDSPNLGKTRIAWLDTVPRGVTMIELDMNLDDLTDYMNEESFIFTATGYLESKVTEQVDFLAEFRYVMQGGLGQ